MRIPFHRSKAKSQSKAQDPPAPVPPVAPGDLPEPFEPGRKVKPDEVRHLAELIRKRYELDIEIWRLRDAQPRDRPHIREKMRRADATLLKIYRTVHAWDRRDVFESDADWAKWQDIKGRLEREGKRWWAANPPWGEE